MAFLATFVGLRASVAPVLWMSPEGAVYVKGHKAEARLADGAKTVETPYGLGLDVGGKHGGLLLPNYPELALTDSMTVSAWVFLRQYDPTGQGAQILFRGDDRSGNDPYDLVVRGDGTVNFGVGKRNDTGVYVSTKIPLKKWTHVVASYNASLGELKISLDGRQLAVKETDRLPFADLDRKQVPGVGIGNVQNDPGPHDQALDGIIADLRLYDGVLSPAEAGWRPAGS